METTSLTGSKDAPETVHRMMAAFENADPMRGYMGKKGQDILAGALSGLEKEVLALTGDVTKARFEDVEKRRGFFAAGAARKNSN